jgi:hypothetical protein
LICVQSGERYKHIITSGPHTFKGDLNEAWGAGGTAPEYAHSLRLLLSLFLVSSMGGARLSSENDSYS